MSEPPVGPGQPPSDPDDAPPPPPPPPPSAPPTAPSYGEATPPPPPPSYGDVPPPSAPPVSGASGWGSVGPAATGERPGELGDRFVARLIDHVLLGVVNFVISLVILAGVLGLDSGSDFGGFSAGGSFAAAAISALIGTAIQLGYFAYFDSTRGRTLGKMAMKLRVEGPGGGKPTVQESVKRNIWIAFGLAGIIPFLGFIGGIATLVAVIVIAVQISNDQATRRPWTDKFADTRVVKDA